MNDPSSSSLRPKHTLELISAQRDLEKSQHKSKFKTSWLVALLFLFALAAASLVLSSLSFTAEEEVINGIYPAVKAASVGPLYEQAKRTFLLENDRVLMVDGVPVMDGDRILLKNEPNPKLNGIYIKQGKNLLRSEDMSHKNQIHSGVATFVLQGLINGGASFMLFQLMTGSQLDPVTRYGIVFENYTALLLSAEEVPPPAGSVLIFDPTQPNQVGWTDGSDSGWVREVDSGTGLTGGPITNKGTLSLANTGVTAGAYTLPDFLTVNAQGQITSVSGITTVDGAVLSSANGTPQYTITGLAGQVLTSNGSGLPTWSTHGGSGTVTSVAAGTGLAASPSPITMSGTISLDIPVVIANGGTNSTAALMNNQIMISNGGAIVEGGIMTAGQILIGATGGLPLARNITPGTAVSVTNGANSITIDLATIAANSLMANVTSSAAIPSAFSVTGGTLVSSNNTNITLVAAGSVGQILQSNGTALPTWVNPTGGTVTSISAADTTLTFSPNPITTTGTIKLTVPVVISSGGTNSTAALIDNQIMVSRTGAIVEAGAMINGQLLIGSTGAAPVVATLTQGTGVTISSGAGSITISATGTGGTVTSIAAGTGLSASPSPITTTGTISLAAIAANSLLANATTSSAVPSAFSITGGTLLSSDNTNITLVAAGSVGQILQSNGTALPTWVNASSFGVTSVRGTSVNQISPTTATMGAVVLTLPQDIGTASDVQFDSLALVMVGNLASQLSLSGTNTNTSSVVTALSLTTTLSPASGSTTLSGITNNVTLSPTLGLTTGAFSYYDTSNISVTTGHTLAIAAAQYIAPTITTNGVGVITQGYGLCVAPTFVTNNNAAFTEATGLSLLTTFNNNATLQIQAMYRGLYVQQHVGADNSNIVVAAAIYVDALTGNNAITTTYGLYVENQTVGNITYAAYFNGNTVVNTTNTPQALTLSGTNTNISATVTSLYLNTTLSPASGSTTLSGINNNVTISPTLDLTTGAFSYYDTSHISVTTGHTIAIAAAQYLAPTFTLAGTGIFTSASGSLISPTFTTASTGTFGFLSTLSLKPILNNAGSGTQSTYYGGYVLQNIQANAGTITTMAGLYIETPTQTAGSAPTTLYGLYINTQSLGSTNYAAYMKGDVVITGIITQATWQGNVIAIAYGGTNSGTALTNNQIMISKAGAIVEAGAMTSGQLLIGSTGTFPAISTLTPGSGVTITNGAGSITISATGTGGTVTSVAAGSGLSASPSPITTTGTISLAAIAANSLMANATTSSAVPSAFSVTGGTLVSSNNTNITLVAAGSAGQLLQSNGTALPTWVDASSFGVTSVRGTSVNQISPTTATMGAVVLTLPQDIGTSSSVNFNSCTLTGVLTVNGTLTTASTVVYYAIISNVKYEVPLGDTSPSVAGLYVSNIYNLNLGTITNFAAGVYVDTGTGNNGSNIPNAYGVYAKVPVAGTNVNTALYGDNLSVGYSLNTPPSNGMIVQGQAAIGAATTTSNFRFQVAAATTDVCNTYLYGTFNAVDGSNSQNGLYCNNQFNPSSGASGYCNQLYIAPVFIAPTSRTITNACGINVYLHPSSNLGTISTLYGIFINTGDGGGGGGSSITTAYGLYVNTPTAATTNYCAFFNGSIYLANNKSVYGLDTGNTPRSIGIIASDNVCYLGNNILNTYVEGAVIHLFAGGSGSGVDSVLVTSTTLIQQETNANTTFGGGGGGMSLVNLYNTTNAYYEIFFSGNSGSAYAEIAGQCTNQGSSYGDIVFGTRSAAGYGEKMRILSTGNVGIGNNVATSQVGLYVKQTVNYSGVGYAIYLGSTVAPTSDGSSQVAISNQCTFSTATNTISNVYGMYTQNTYTGSKVISNAYGMYIDTDTTSSFVSGVINSYGLYLTTPTVGNNNYGLYINQSSSGAGLTVNYTGHGSGVAYIDTGGTFWVTDTGGNKLVLGVSSQVRMTLDNAGNVGIGATISAAGSSVVLFIANATTTPTSNPSGGGILYVTGGALTYRGSSGHITTIAIA